MLTQTFVSFFLLTSSFIDEVFTKIQSGLPLKCSATINGKSIQKRLKTIPKESTVKGKKPTVKLYFEKGKGFEVVVENVEELYRDLFREQFSALNNPLFKGDKKRWEKFKRKYEIKRLEKYKVPIIKIRKKTRKNEWYLIYLSPDLTKIMRIDFYSSGKLYVSSLIRYAKFGKYTLPSKILVKVFGKKREKAELFTISDYKFNRASLKSERDAEK